MPCGGIGYGFHFDTSCTAYCTCADRVVNIKFSGPNKACFDEISHQWILDHIPSDSQVIEKWLKAGYVEDGTAFPCRKETPQGGILSPVIANMVLDGLESAVRATVLPRRNGVPGPKVNVVRYADDFIITGNSRAFLETKVKPAIESFPERRGRQLSATKTRIVRIEEGVDFLGQNIRKYNGKLFIKPSKASIRSVLDKINKTIRKNRGMAAEVLIGALNPVLYGWVNYHRHVVAKRVLSKIRDHLYRQLWKWMRRKHGNKNSHWLARKYGLCGNKPWVFSAKATKKSKERIYELLHPQRVVIVRHTKIKGMANPFDSKWDRYFMDRRVVLARQKLYVV